MARILGRGRNVFGTYPEGSAAAGAAVAALRNRNIADTTILTVPFTPANSLIAAILFTPKVSGVLQLSSNLLLQNGAGADTYALAMEIIPGTGLSVSGGETTSNGWVIGSGTPPVIGGTIGSPVIGVEALTALAGNADGSLTPSGFSQPLPIGVPVVIAVVLTEVAGGNALVQLAFTNLSVMELP
jgi:hypothetical protein